MRDVISPLIRPSLSTPSLSAPSMVAPSSSSVGIGVGVDLESELERRYDAETGFWRLMRDVTLQSDTEPFALLLSSTMVSVYRGLAIAWEKGASWPEAEPLDGEQTAAAILSRSTRQFWAYQQHHPDQSLPEQVRDFSRQLSVSVAEGYGEGRMVLKEMGRLTPDLAAKVDESQRLVELGIDRFTQMLLAS